MNNELVINPTQEQLEYSDLDLVVAGTKHYVNMIEVGAREIPEDAIADAITAIALPVVEVHLSNVEEREEWRRHSVIADLVAHRVLGKGPDGYREALAYLAGGQT